MTVRLLLLFALTCGDLSHESVPVSRYRKMLKAVCSFAMLTRDFTESQANGIIQTAYGDDTETVVPSDEIKGLTDQWV